MSNCISFPSGFSFPFTPEALNIQGLMARINTADERSPEWWFLETAASLDAEGILHIDFNSCRSSHTWRSLIGTCAVLGEYLQQITYLKKVAIIDDGQPDVTNKCTICIHTKPTKPGQWHPHHLHSRGMHTISWKKAV
jgi:hypothetical protein